MGGARCCGPLLQQSADVRIPAHVSVHNREHFCNLSSCSTNNSPQGRKRRRANSSSQHLFFLLFSSSRNRPEPTSLQATNGLFTRAEHKFFSPVTRFLHLRHKKREFLSDEAVRMGCRERRCNFNSSSQGARRPLRLLDLVPTSRASDRRPATSCCYSERSLPTVRDCSPLLCISASPYCPRAQMPRGLTQIIRLHTHTL